MPRLSEAPRQEEAEDDPAQRMREVLGGPAPGTWWTVTQLVPEVMDWANYTLGVFLPVGMGLNLVGEDQKPPENRVDPQLKELTFCRAGWGRGSQFVFSQHSKAMRMVGLSEEKVDAIPYWQTADCYSALERLVLAYTDDIVMHGGRVPEERVAALKEHLSDPEILELTYCAALYNLFATVCKALRVEYDDRPDPVVEVPWNNPPE